MSIITNPIKPETTVQVKHIISAFAHLLELRRDYFSAHAELQKNGIELELTATQISDIENRKFAIASRIIDFVLDGMIVNEKKDEPSKIIRGAR